MTNEIQNQCRCERASCGCANETRGRCICGAQCACKPTCRCGASCAC